MNKILFFKLGALGDVLMTTPLVREVRKLYPEAHIDYYVGDSYYNALCTNDDINDIKTFDEDIFHKQKVSKMLKLIRKIRNEKYDCVFVLDKHYVFSLIMWACRIPVRIGFDRDLYGMFNNYNVHYKDVRHEIDYYLEMLICLYSKMNPERISIDQPSTDIKFNLMTTDIEYAKQVFKDNNYTKENTICVIPGGANNAGVGDDMIRRWPEHKYAALINTLEEKEYNFILLGGNEDIKINEEVMKRVWHKDSIINLTGKTTLHKSAAIMSMCKQVICNDSGPMHLASAVNKNIISLFGPTHPERKAPLYKESVAIWKDNDIYNDQYELYGKYDNDFVHKNFMNRLAVSDVLEEALR